MSDVLTPAEKAKITRAFNAAKERKAQAAFEAESKRTGGRKAKQDAKANAVWLAKELKSDPKDKTQSKDDAKAKNQANDKIESRKRTSSSVAVADKPKKAKETPANESDGQEVLTGGKGKSKVKSTQRKHAAPTIAIDTDDEEPKPKQKTGKAKTTTISKTSKTAAVPAVKPTAAIKPAKLVPESDSESSSSSNDSDVSDAGVPDAEEFLIEAPRIIGKRTKPVAIVSDEEDNEMADAPPRAAQHLFDDEAESDGIDPLLEALKRAAELKAKKGQLSDDDMAGFESDHEFHEQMAKATRYIEPIAPRGRSLSTGSWSSGYGLAVPDTDDEGLADVALYDESGDEEERAVKTKKTRKVSTARQKKADLERPKVRSAPQVKSAPYAAASSLPSRPESSYHESARFVNPPPGKDVRLNDQPDACKAVVRGAIVLLKTGIFCENSYMQILSRTGFGKGYLVQSAENLGDDAVHIKQRLMTDPKYLAVLADLLVDRVNIIRGSVKKVAASLAPGLYKILGLTPEATKKLIEELLKDHRYIFGIDPHTSRIKTDEPFLHAAIIAVIKQAILTGAFKAQVEHLFASTDPDHPEHLELPDAMVCIATTAVYATLVEYRTTGERQPINFTEAAYEDTYRNHMKTIADTRVYAPKALGQVLHRLYLETTETKSAQPSAGSSATLINLVDIPGADA
ncbi:hypothetical protein B0H14DRAFT_3877811 [Mycena olivaceomarginata]|nr:hypothetical protein B0H14DRAFT_3877811 [Mycena olivaceomarginata]